MTIVLLELKKGQEIFAGVQNAANQIGVAVNEMTLATSAAK